MTENKTSKFWLKSKTVLFNLMLTIGGTWSAIEASTENLRASISAKNFGLLMAAVGVIGVILRAISKEAIHHKKTGE